jgi:hypothetical protein
VASDIISLICFTLFRTIWIEDDTVEDDTVEDDSSEDPTVLLTQEEMEAETVFDTPALPSNMRASRLGL